MTRTSFLILSAVLVSGCKAKKEVKDNPATLRDLEVCKSTLDEKNKLVTALQDENARLMRGSAKAGEIVVAIEGNALTVRPSAPGVTPPIDQKAAAAASKVFLDLVGKSRGAIQRCYEQALKKNSAIQGRTITLTVSASFSNTGAYESASFSPSLGDVFDGCIKTVAAKWQLPKDSPAMTFKASVSLTPS